MLIFDESYSVKTAGADISHGACPSRRPDQTAEAAGPAGTWETREWNIPGQQFYQGRADHPLGPRGGSR